MKRGKIHWITQNIKVGIETRKLIRYPPFMMFVSRKLPVLTLSSSILSV